MEHVKGKDENMVQEHGERTKSKGQENNQKKKKEKKKIPSTFRPPSLLVLKVLGVLALETSMLRVGPVEDSVAGEEARQEVEELAGRSAVDIVDAFLGPFRLKKKTPLKQQEKTYPLKERLQRPSAPWGKWRRSQCP